MSAEHKPWAATAKPWADKTFEERIVAAAGGSPAAVLWSCVHDLRTVMNAAESEHFDETDAGMENLVGTLIRVTLTIEAVASEVAARECEAKDKAVTQ